jgi:hypothetical protein
MVPVSLATPLMSVGNFKPDIYKILLRAFNVSATLPSAPATLIPEEDIL